MVRAQSGAGRGHRSPSGLALYFPPCPLIACLPVVSLVEMGSPWAKLVQLYLLREPNRSLAQRRLEKVLRAEPFPSSLDPATGQQPQGRPSYPESPGALSGARVWPAVSPPGGWALWPMEGASACCGPCPGPGLRSPVGAPHLASGGRGPGPAGGRPVIDAVAGLWAEGSACRCQGTWPGWPGGFEGQEAGLQEPGSPGGWSRARCSWLITLRLRLLLW